MKIAKLLTAWRVDAKPPSYRDLLEVQEDQQELLKVLDALLVAPLPIWPDSPEYKAGVAVIAKHEEPAQTKNYCWECNECGSKEYTMCVSEHDVHQLGCSGCGGDEFHKVPA